MNEFNDLEQYLALIQVDLNQLKASHPNPEQLVENLSRLHILTQQHTTLLYYFLTIINSKDPCVWLPLFQYLIELDQLNGQNCSYALSSEKPAEQLALLQLLADKDQRLIKAYTEKVLAANHADDLLNACQLALARHQFTCRDIEIIFSQFDNPVAHKSFDDALLSLRKKGLHFAELELLVTDHPAPYHYAALIIGLSELSFSLPQSHALAWQAPYPDKLLEAIKVLHAADLLTPERTQSLLTYPALCKRVTQLVSRAPDLVQASVDLLAENRHPQLDCVVDQLLQRSLYPELLQQYFAHPKLPVAVACLQALFAPKSIDLQQLCNDKDPEVVQRVLELSTLLLPYNSMLQEIAAQPLILFVLELCKLAESLFFDSKKHKVIKAWLTTPDAAHIQTLHELAFFLEHHRFLTAKRFDHLISSNAITDLHTSVVLMCNNQPQRLNEDSLSKLLAHRQPLVLTKCQLLLISLNQLTPKLTTWLAGQNDLSLVDSTLIALSESLCIYQLPENFCERLFTRRHWTKLHTGLIALARSDAQHDPLQFENYVQRMLDSHTCEVLNWSLTEFAKLGPIRQDLLTHIFSVCDYDQMLMLRKHRHETIEDYIDRFAENRRRCFGNFKDLLPTLEHLKNFVNPIPEQLCALLFANEQVIRFYSAIRQFSPNVKIPLSCFEKLLSRTHWLASGDADNILQMLIRRTLSHHLNTSQWVNVLLADDPDARLTLYFTHNPDHPLYDPATQNTHNRYAHRSASDSAQRLQARYGIDKHKGLKTISREVLDLERWLA